jgi:arylsulfatase A-like enzyme
MNVLVICVDTLRWDHVGYNKKFPVLTPNMDRLAARSTIFDRCLISSFPTNPMRTDCITGNCNFPRYAWKALGDEEVVLSEVMGEAGYHTGLVVDTGPMSGLHRGFDDFHKAFNPPPDAPDPEDVDCPVPLEHIRQNGMQRQSQMAGLAHARYETDFWVGRGMTKAAEWLEDNARREKWLLWVDTFEVHEVWHTPPHYIELYSKDYEGLDYDFPNYGYTDIYSRKELKRLWARYAAEVTFTDRWIGHLMTQMDVMNLWDNTMVVLISDHGTYIGEHKRAGKHTVRSFDDVWPLYEEVSHIPLLVYIPKKKGLKKRVKALAQPPDLMPTILEACRVKGPKMHGKSWLPLMTGKKSANWDVVYSANHTGPMLRNTICPTYISATTPRWTYIAEEPGHKPELYDMRVDPGQKKNLARKQPDVCAKMQKDLVKFLRRQNAVEEYWSKFDI